MSRYTAIIEQCGESGGRRKSLDSDGHCIKVWIDSEGGYRLFIELIGHERNPRLNISLTDWGQRGLILYSGEVDNAAESRLRFAAAEAGPESAMRVFSEIVKQQLKE